MGSRTPLHHGYGDVNRCDDRVIRRGRPVHHERIVEVVEIQRRAVAFLHMNHRSHGESRKHLMRGLNRENSRHILYFSTYSHRESFRINRMELRICIPCLIKMDARHAVFQGIDDFAGIVAETVIRAVGHHRVGGLL